MQLCNETVVWLPLQTYSSLLLDSRSKTRSYQQQPRIVAVGINVAHRSHDDFNFKMHSSGERFCFSCIVFIFSLMKRVFADPFSFIIIITDILGNCSCLQSFRDTLRDTPHLYLFALLDTIEQIKPVSFHLHLNWKKKIIIK